jgi:hypothetical protein
MYHLPDSHRGPRELWRASEPGPRGKKAQQSPPGKPGQGPTPGGQSPPSNSPGGPKPPKRH